MLRLSMGKGVRLRGAALAAIAATSSIGAATLVSTDASAQAAYGRPWLGVAMDTDAPGPGVRVGHVVRGSPADVAGIRESDRLLRIGSIGVARGADVVRAVSASAIGDTLEVTFTRGNTGRSARVTLAAYPSPDDMMRMDLVGSTAPTWRDVEAVSGTFPPSIASVRGRVVLLDFWATWCAPCRVVMPKLGALQARYGAQGLSVLGLSTEEAQDVALFAQRMPSGYAMAVDKHAQTTRSYGVISLPTLVVIDKRGVVRDVSIGYDPMNDTHLEATVRSLLAEAAPNAPPLAPSP
jgi:thiol-disulfide isomerase/thioredoxin